MNPQQGGKLRAAKVHCPSHPTSFWRACLSSALKHLVFSVSETLLQIEAEEGSKWEHLQGEVKCQRGSATSTCTTVFLTRIFLKGVHRVYPLDIMQFHPLRLPCPALPIHLWASGILPAQPNPWRLYFLLEFPQKKPHHDGAHGFTKKQQKVFLHPPLPCKDVNSKGPGGNPMASWILVFPKTPTTQDMRDVY